MGSPAIHWSMITGIILLGLITIVWIDNPWFFSFREFFDRISKQTERKKKLREVNRLSEKQRPGADPPGPPLQAPDAARKLAQKKLWTNPKDAQIEDAQIGSFFLT